MTDEEFLVEMLGMIRDVNPAEIQSHDTDESLKDWCRAWQHHTCLILCKAFLEWRQPDV